jgi:toxin-antitoxin system PIN domain toxin
MFGLCVALAGCRREAELEPTIFLKMRVQAWFRKQGRQGWATCPLTQAGFIRIAANPAFSPDAVTPQEAAALLHSNLKHPSHEFWADEISFVDAVTPFQKELFGHRQVTDAYLVGLVMHKKGKLVTVDRGVAALLPKDPTATVRGDAVSCSSRR